MTLATESAGSLLARDPEAAAAQLARAQELARGAIEELRSVVSALRPASVEAEGLAGALRKHVEVLRRVTGREIALRDAGAAEAAPALDDDAAAQVFRIAQEALQNALRHAGAGQIEVRLEAGPPLVLTVADDGCGFDPDEASVRSQRLGLTSMEERAAALGARLAISSREDEGTTVRLELPA